VKDFLEGKDGDKLEKVVFCTFVPKDVDAYNYWLP
jgi:O-acetyl-ADP-ribose deacetylase